MTSSLPARNVTHGEEKASDPLNTIGFDQVSPRLDDRATGMTPLGLCQTTERRPVGSTAAMGKKSALAFETGWRTNDVVATPAGETATAIV
jgi:hypothetical protein